MSYIYILLCEDGTYYTGYTKDLEGRFQKHKEGKGAKYTKIHKPVKIVYYEEYEDDREAMRREYRIKQLSHQEKENLVKYK